MISAFIFCVLRSANIRVYTVAMTDLIPCQRCHDYDDLNPFADKGALWMNMMMAIFDKKASLVSFLERDVRIS